MRMHEGIPPPTRADQVGKELFWTVLPSASQVVAGTVLSADQVKRGLRDLKRQEFVEIHELGCLLPAVPLVRFTETGLDHFEATEEERSWRRPDGLGNLILYDFSKVEAVTAVAPFYVTGGWILWRIHFYERQPMIAAAEYRHPEHRAPAYLVFCWASMMDTQRELFERLEALPEAMQAQSIEPNYPFYPAGLAFVANGEWGAARALCMAHAVLDPWVESGSIAGWYYGGNGWCVSDAVSALTGVAPEGIPPLLEPIDRLRPSISTRKLGTRKVENVLARSLWAGRRGHMLFELLTLVGICPCGSVAHYRSLMGENPGGKETGKRLKCLEGLGLVEVVKEFGRAERPKRWPKDVPLTLSEQGQGAHRYDLTLSGRAWFCYAHGGRPEDLFRRTKLGRLKTWVHERTCNRRCDRTCAGRIEDGWLYQHEDIVYEIFGQARKAGCAIAPGWQARTTLADGRRIDPDGLLLVLTPWGRMWCRLEVELSDRTYEAVKPRCAKYGSPHRRDNLPVLVACRDDRAEWAFRFAAFDAEADSQPLPRMLTTTLSRLKQGGVFDADVWSYYDRPVTLAP